MYASGAILCTLLCFAAAFSVAHAEKVLLTSGSAGSLGSNVSRLLLATTGGKQVLGSRTLQVSKSGHLYYSAVEGDLAFTVGVQSRTNPPSATSKTYITVSNVRGNSPETIATFTIVGCPAAVLGNVFVQSSGSIYQIYYTTACLNKCGNGVVDASFIDRYQYNANTKQLSGIKSHTLIYSNGECNKKHDTYNAVAIRNTGGKLLALLAPTNTDGNYSPASTKLVQLAKGQATTLWTNKACANPAGGAIVSDSQFYILCNDDKTGSSGVLLVTKGSNSPAIVSGAYSSGATIFGPNFDVSGSKLFTLKSACCGVNLFDEQVITHSVKSTAGPYTTTVNLPRLPSVSYNTWVDVDVI